MFVTIRYYKPTMSGYAGMGYSYKTELPLKVGDKVIAPTKGGDNRAIVVEVNVPESKIDERVMPYIKEITQYDTEGGETA